MITTTKVNFQETTIVKTNKLITIMKKYLLYFKMTGTLDDDGIAADWMEEMNF